MIIFLFMILSFARAQDCPPKEEPQTKEQICFSLYYKDEIFEAPDKKEVVAQCEKFCTSNQCKMKHANIGSIDRASKNFYQVCICE